MKKILTLALVLVAGVAQAQSSPAKKELVNRILVLQQAPLLAKCSVTHWL